MKQNASVLPVVDVYLDNGLEPLTTSGDDHTVLPPSIHPLAVEMVYCSARPAKAQYPNWGHFWLPRLRRLRASGFIRGGEVRYPALVPGEQDGLESVVSAEGLGDALEFGMYRFG